VKIYIDTYDVTNYILEEEGLELSLERERATHERVVNDVNMSFSNINGFFNQLFQTASATSKYWVKIYADTEVNLDFYGVVDLQSVIYSPTGASVTFNAFSSEREFWDRCKNKTIYQVPRFSAGIYKTLEQIIGLQLVLERDALNLFTSVSVETELASKNIRYAQNANPDIPEEATVGNYGKYSNLDPKATVFDLFTAFCINYNAEFYIDNNTKTLHFRRRKAVTSTTSLAIDDKLIEDAEISVKLIDDDKYDYVECLYKLPKPSTIISMTGLTATLSFGLVVGTLYEWVMTCNYANGIESNRSEIFYYQQTAMLYVGGQPTLNYKIHLTIPTPNDINVISVNIYRRNVNSSNSTINVFRKIATVNSFPNSYTDYLTREAIIANPENYPQILDAVESQTIWIGYDDAIKSWKPVIFNNQNGANQPQGKIFQSIPKLNWIDPITQNTISDSVYMFYFFGMETDISFLLDTWRDLMTIKHKLETTINDMTLTVGDSVTTQKLKLFPGIQPLYNVDNFRLVKILKELIKRESRITGVTV
jgi:hypothetical protein